MVVEMGRLEAAVADGVEHYRRRAGRSDVRLNPIPVLRGPAGAQLLPDKWAPREPLAPAYGVALGVVLSIPLWAAICAVLYAACR
jgi:hypothetical protein